MKKKSILILLCLLIVLISVFAFMYKDNFITHLKEDNSSYSRLDKPLKQDFLIESDNVSGKSIINQGSFKMGDLVIVQGMTVKLEKIGWKPYLIKEAYGEMDSKGIGTAIFKLTVANYNLLPYEIKSEDIIIIYGDKKYEQDLKVSGYESWKYVKNSFQFEPIATKQYREGYIFFPAKQEVKEGGIVKIYLQDIPITFKY